MIIFKLKFKIIYENNVSGEILTASFGGGPGMARRTGGSGSGRPWEAAGEAVVHHGATRRVFRAENAAFSTV